MNAIDVVLSALVLGLLVKTCLIEDRVKKLREHAGEESEKGRDDVPDGE